MPHRPRPLSPPSGRARRAARVASVLTRHGLRCGPSLAFSSGRPAALGRSLAAAYEELGPTFIKLGQLIAASPGLFPEGLCAEVGRCRDQVASLDWHVVADTIGESLRRSPDEVFAWIDPRPLSSASVAQVHAAQLPSGQRVVVKVRRPGIGQVVATDLALLEDSTSLLRSVLPSGARSTAEHVLTEFRRTITEELDLSVEAEYQRRMRRILRSCGSGEVVAPAVVDELSTPDVLVAERLDGVLFDDVDAVAASGLDPLDLLHHAVRTIQETAIVHGLFHGDLHSANLLVLPDGRLGYVDFGIMGYLDPDSSRALGRFFAGMLFEDYPFVVEALEGLAVLPPDLDRQRLLEDLREGASRIFARGLTGWELGPMIRLAVRLAFRHRARLSQGVVLLAKQLLYLDGAARALAPDADLMGEALEILLYFDSRYPELSDEILPPTILDELRSAGPHAVRERRAGRSAAGG